MKDSHAIHYSFASTHFHVTTRTASCQLTVPPRKFVGTFLHHSSFFPSSLFTTLSSPPRYLRLNTIGRIVSPATCTFHFSFLISRPHLLLLFLQKSSSPFLHRPTAYFLLIATHFTTATFDSCLLNPLHLYKYLPPSTGTLCDSCPLFPRISTSQPLYPYPIPRPPQPTLSNQLLVQR